MASRPTIKDVAQKSGFSIATVSMVLNNKKVSIPEETRAKVLAAAESLGYRPNRLALSLLTKRTNMLGLLIPDSNSLFFTQLSQAVEAVAREAGYSVVYGHSGSTATDLAYLDMFLDYQVDGLIVLPSIFPDAEMEEAMFNRLQSIHVPVVLVDRQTSHSEWDILQTDHYRSGYLVAEHLLKLGHKRIGCFGTNGIISSRDARRTGYRDAIRDFGLDPEHALVPLALESGRHIDHDAVRKLLENGVTAVQTVDDTTAVALYRAAGEVGVQIPEDLSVVGHDDLFFADMLSPPLTTVHQPVEEIGAATVQTMLRLLDDGQNTAMSKTIQLFKPTLVVRGSTAPPAGAK